MCTHLLVLILPHVALVEIVAVAAGKRAADALAGLVGPSVLKDAELISTKRLPPLDKLLKGHALLMRSGEDYDVKDFI